MCVTNNIQLWRANRLSDAMCYGWHFCREGGRLDSATLWTVLLTQLCLVRNVVHSWCRSVEGPLSQYTYGISHKLLEFSCRIPRFAVTEFRKCPRKFLRCIRTQSADWPQEHTSMYVHTYAHTYIHVWLTMAVVFTQSRWHSCCTKDMVPSTLHNACLWFIDLWCMCGTMICDAMWCHMMSHDTVWHIPHDMTWTDVT